MIEVNVPVGVSKVTTNPAYQWDYGQKLRITGNIPSACEVHFCNKNTEKAIVRIGSLVDVNTIEAFIPDTLLEQQWEISAFVYLEGEGSGQTIKHIIIPITKRKQPEDSIDPIPEEAQTELDRMIANVNGALEKIEGYYNETITQSELEMMIYRLVEESISEFALTYDNAIANLEKTNLTLSTQIKALDDRVTALDEEVREYPTSLTASKTTLVLDQDDLNEGEDWTGVVHSITITPTPSDKQMNLAILLLNTSGSGEVAYRIYNNTAQFSYIRSGQGTKKFKVYDTVNPAAYVEITVEMD